jgi:hypothetical protein
MGSINCAANNIFDVLSYILNILFLRLISHINALVVHFRSSIKSENITSIFQCAIFRLNVSDNDGYRENDLDIDKLPRSKRKFRAHRILISQKVQANKEYSSLSNLIYNGVGTKKEYQTNMLGNLALSAKCLRKRNFKEHI